MAQVPDGTRRRLLAVAALIGVAVATVAVVWMMLSGQQSDDAARPAPGIEGAVETSAPPDPSSTPTPAAPATTTGAPRPAPVQPDPVTSERIVYRRDGALFLAKSDGSGEKRLVSSPEGPYELSPDGDVLAHVDSGRLQLVRTSDGAVMKVGAALGDDAGIGGCLAWTPDSKALYFTRATAEGRDVWRTDRDGGAAVRVTRGGCPSVSPDGRVVAVVDSADGVVRVSRDGGRFMAMPAPSGVPVAVAAGDSALYVSVLNADGSTALVSTGLDGQGEVRIAGPPADAPRVSWGSLWLSPDGSRLAALAVGDDRYSRVAIVDLRTREVRPLSARRDSYARYWSSGGTHLYYVEGNAYQGEATNLLRVDRLGAGRRVIAEGAE
ncbi:MAG: hypothetical protein U1E26_11210 [Coriobacteriia bacterium]|nr:hypothetical protein [Coriobacteriia bacterium]